MSHAFGELAGSCVGPMQQRAAGGRHGRHLESMTSYQQKPTPSIDATTNFIPIRFEMTES